MPATVQFGSRGFDVARLQLQLNLQRVVPDLIIDGIFGPLTKTNVVSFQRSRGLVPDGIAGPKTHAAAAMDVKMSAFDNPIRLISQSTPTTCWAASTAMMTGSTVAAVKAKTPPEMINEDGSLNHHAKDDQGVATGMAFARIHGLHFYPPMSWPVPLLLKKLARSPLMMDMLWNSADYAAGKGSPGHMVVANSVVSDEDPNGDDTHLQIYNPLPVNVGKISWEQYSFWIQMVSTRTYWVFSR
jgi:hypothetical protein